MNELMLDGMAIEQIEDADIIQLVGMKLGEEEYAIDVLKIQEIIRTVEITIVPRSEGYILGVMNLRGKVIPVVDLRVRFSLTKVDFDKSTRIIVVRFEKENIGFVVDEVTQVIRIARHMVEPTPPLVGAVGQEYILGICKYNERLMILLDIDRVVGETSEDSSLKQRLHNVRVTKRHEIQKKPAVKAKISAPQQSEPEPVKKSMADEADALSKPMISTIQTDEDDLLNSIEEQAKIKPSAGSNFVEQDDLDSLIAIQLAKCEAETEELNKKKKQKEEAAAVAPEPVVAPVVASVPAPVVEPAEELSIDDQIAMELAKREAETEELNKKKFGNNPPAKDEPVKAQAPEPAVTPLTIEQQIAQELAKKEAAERATGDAEKKNELTSDSIDDLKSVAKKIINGETDTISADVKGEVRELLSVIMGLKKRIDDISPTVLSTQKDLPEMNSTLTDVNTATEKAAFNLLESAQNMGNFYKQLAADVEELEKLIDNKNLQSFESKKESITANASKASALGFTILEALEFQDITEQQLRKTIKSIDSIGARLGSILGFMGSKCNKEELNNLLSDLGFA